MNHHNNELIEISRVQMEMKKMVLETEGKETFVIVWPKKKSLAESCLQLCRKQNL